MAAPKPPQGPLLALAAACLALALLLLVQGCEWPPESDGPSGDSAGGILEDQWLTSNGRHRVCLYSDGTALTVRSLELCPAAN